MSSNADDLPGQPGGQPPGGGAAPPAEEMFPASVVRELRQENAKWRTKVRDLEDQARPREQEKDAEIHRLRGDLSLERAFAKHGVKPSLTRAYLTDTGAMDKIRATDPRAQDFDELIDTIVGEAAVEEPGLRGRTSPARGATEMNGPGTPTANQLGRGELGDMTPDEISRALKQGRLDDLLGRIR